RRRDYTAQLAQPRAPLNDLRSTGDVAGSLLDPCWILAGSLLGDWPAWTEPRCPQGASHVLRSSCAVAAKLKPAVRGSGSVGRGNGAYRMTYAQPKSEPSSALQLMGVGDPHWASSAPHVLHEVFCSLLAAGRQPSLLSLGGSIALAVQSRELS